MEWNEVYSEYFRYENGKIFWKKQPRGPNKVLGKETGVSGSNGYLHSRLFGKSHLVHRIIFSLHHGYLPDFIDHKDRNKRNNKIENLRKCTTSENIRNRGILKNNKSGITGVRFNKRSKKYRVQIGNNGKQIDLGSYINLNDAIIARKKGEQKYGYK